MKQLTEGWGHMNSPSTSKVVNFRISIYVRTKPCIMCIAYKCAYVIYAYVIE